MKKLLAGALATLALAACDEVRVPRWEVDQEKRQQLFQACLRAVPDGPRVTRSSDWADVVRSCETAAAQQSLVCVANCWTLPGDRKGAQP